jgi:hypothetical protein
MSANFSRSVDRNINAFFDRWKPIPADDTCPTDGLLAILGNENDQSKWQSLLESRLGAEPASRWISHVNSCSNCWQVIDLLHHKEARIPVDEYLRQAGIETDLLKAADDRKPAGYLLSVWFGFWGLNVPRWLRKKK